MLELMSTLGNPKKGLARKSCPHTAGCAQLHVFDRQRKKQNQVQQEKKEPQKFKIQKVARHCEDSDKRT